MIGAEELADISSYQMLSGSKIKKLLSDHEARQKSWRIYEPLVIKLLTVLKIELTDERVVLFGNQVRSAYNVASS